MNTSDKAGADPTVDLRVLPAYANFIGPAPSSLLLELALEDPCEDLKQPGQMGTHRQTGETYSTHFRIVSGYEDLDPIWDDD